MDKFTYKAQGTKSANNVNTIDDKLKDLRPKQSDNVEAPIAQSKLYNLRREDYATIFKSPKKAREVWRNIALAVAFRPASKPIVQLDKNGDETFESQVQRYTYDTLANDVDKLGDPDAGPTEIEMILSCQAVMARTNPSAFTAFVDRAGGKPVDESKIDAQVTNPFSDLTDDELEMLIAYREQKSKDQPTD